MCSAHSSCPRDVIHILQSKRAISVKPCEGNLCPLDLPSLPAAAEHWSEFLSADLPPPGDPADRNWAQTVPVSQAQSLLK